MIRAFQTRATRARATRARFAAAAAFKALGLAAAAAGAASAAYQALGERADRRRFPPPGRLVDVNGRKIHVLCDGDQAPTIVVATGIGSTCLEWLHIQRELAPHYRVVLYDRGGLGWSDWVPGSRSASALADELHAVLTAAGIPGKYVLVGHSLGGSIIRLFEARYPELVAGLVLIDTSHEHAHEKIVEEFGWQMGDLGRWKRMIVKYVLRPRGIERARVRLLGNTYYHDWAVKEVPAEFIEASVSQDLSTRRRREIIAETLQNGAASKQELGLSRHHLGDLPLAVITRSVNPGNTYGSSEPEFLRRWMPIWMPLQEDLAALSTNSRHVVADLAGHYVHIDQPTLVCNVIKEICEHAKKRATR